jgi:hypothetical protein
LNLSGIVTEIAQLQRAKAILISAETSAKRKPGRPAVVGSSSKVTRVASGKLAAPAKAKPHIERRGVCTDRYRRMTTRTPTEHSHVGRLILSVPGSAVPFRHDWVVYSKRPFGGPEHACVISALTPIALVSPTAGWSASPTARSASAGETQRTATGSAS